jgi:hypothetical protein
VGGDLHDQGSFASQPEGFFLRRALRERMHRPCAQAGLSGRRQPVGRYRRYRGDEHQQRHSGVHGLVRLRFSLLSAERSRIFLMVLCGVPTRGAAPALFIEANQKGREVFPFCEDKVLRVERLASKRSAVNNCTHALLKQHLLYFYS